MSRIATKVEDGSELQESVRIMARLRRLPDGCPWDREQTYDSIKKHTLEEVYEVFDAIERRDFDGLKDELGDLLLQVLFYAQMAADEGRFTIADVAANLNAKLVRRHPHVFGDAAAADSEAVLRSWEAIKREEKASAGAGGSMLDDVPRTMPAMLEAHKLGSRAAKVGFDWPDATGLFAKMREELQELEEEVSRADADAMEMEFGDLLFTAANLARHLKLDAESALRRSSAKFRNRFAEIEGGLAGLSAEEMERRWAAAKERANAVGKADATANADSFAALRNDKKGEAEGGRRTAEAEGESGNAEGAEVSQRARSKTA